MITLPPAVIPDRSKLFVSRTGIGQVQTTWRLMSVWQAFNIAVMLGSQASLNVRRTSDTNNSTQGAYESIWPQRDTGYNSTLYSYLSLGFSYQTVGYLSQFCVWVCISDLGSLVSLKPTKDPNFPHTCTFCGAPAYIGAVPAALDCSKKCRP